MLETSNQSEPLQVQNHITSIEQRNQQIQNYLISIKQNQQTYAEKQRQQIKHYDIQKTSQIQEFQIYGLSSNHHNNIRSPIHSSFAADMYKYKVPSPMN